MPSYTTTDFLASVRQRGSIPTTTNTNNVNNSTNLLALATEELHINLLPLIMSAREEFYVTSTDLAVTASQSDYVIPTRASGVVLRDVQLISGNSVISLPEVNPDNITTTATGTAAAYYLRHNKVVLYPTPANTDGTSLRLRYFLRPSRLAATSACAQITAIDTGSYTVTVAAVPSTMTTSTPLDLISADAPYQCRAIDYTPTGTGSTTITFSALPSDLAVGDWVALADYTPIPQCPHEFLPVLAQMTVVTALQAIGDNTNAQIAAKKLETLQANALILITPRNEGQSKRVIARRWSR